MSLTTRVCLLAGASALALTGATHADGSATANDQEARIAELEAKVAQLSGNNWVTEERAEELRALVQDVLADADTRASLLQSGGMGYDHGFMLGNADGAFGLRINGQLQTRFVWSNQDEGVGGDANTAGFENTRTKLAFNGHAGDWMFRAQGNFGQALSGGDGVFNLEDAWVGYDMGNGWSVYMGQGKVPFQREYLVDSANQLAVERSAVSYLYPTGRTQGLLVNYKMDQLNLMGSYNDGVAANAGGLNIGNANAPAVTGPDVETAFTFRGEYLISGTWDQFQDFSSAPGGEQGMLLGGAIHWQTAEFGTAAANELDALFLTGDFSMEMDGANLYAAILYGSFDNDAAIDRDTIGFVVQGGYFFNDMWEGFVRYEWNDFDDPAGVTLDDHSVITVGVNAYYSDNVKMTTDVAFGLNEVRNLGTVSGLTGLRDDTSGAMPQDGQIVWRTQLQLTF